MHAAHSLQALWRSPTGAGFPVVVAQAFLSAAAVLDDVVFGISTLAAVGAEFGVAGDGVVLFKKFDEGRADYTGAFTADAITDFVSANSLPLVVAFTAEVRFP